MPPFPLKNRENASRDKTSTISNACVFPNSLLLLPTRVAVLPKFLPGHRKKSKGLGAEFRRNFFSRI